MSEYSRAEDPELKTRLEYIDPEFEGTKYTHAVFKENILALYERIEKLENPPMMSCTSKSKDDISDEIDGPGMYFLEKEQSDFYQAALRYAKQYDNQWGKTFAEDESRAYYTAQHKLHCSMLEAARKLYGTKSH